MQSKESITDHYKCLSEWALAAGRNLQNKQTNYIHYHHGEHNQEHYTIPLLENTLFALALFRSRLVEQIQEAKVILKGLLAFQNFMLEETYGNFPLYQHNFPNCNDSTIALQMLAPFYWILKQFGHVLGSDLKASLEHSANMALEFSIKNGELKNQSYALAVRLSAAQYAFGCLWGRLDWQQKGIDDLNLLSEKQLDGWYSTTHLGDILVGLQMVYLSLSNSPWDKLWKQLENTWDFKTGTYVGPCVREWQDGDEPQAHLYDLFAGYFSEAYSKRAMVCRPYHLQGILIQPTLDKFENVPNHITQGILKEQKWETVFSENKSYTLLEKKGFHSPSLEKTYTPLQIVFGNLQRVHTFVCQGGSYTNVEYSVDGSLTKLIFDLKDDREEGKGNVEREVEFFLDVHPSVTFSLEGKTTSTFELGQSILISSDEMRLLFKLELLQGEGHFLAHIMRANRPAQKTDRGEKRFEAYDWSIFLRTIRRKSNCRIQATLSFEIA